MVFFFFVIRIDTSWFLLVLRLSEFKWRWSDPIREKKKLDPNSNLNLNFVNSYFFLAISYHSKKCFQNFFLYKKSDGNTNNFRGSKPLEKPVLVLSETDKILGSAALVADLDPTFDTNRIPNLAELLSGPDLTKIPGSSFLAGSFTRDKFDSEFHK